MLQFIAEENDKYSIAEQMQMAIEGGCKWVQLSVPEMPDDRIRELAGEIIPLCKETSTILTIEDHVELAKELGVHGVHLTGSGMSAAAVRELLGPEAIVGVEVGIPSAVLALKGVDVDFVSFTKNMPVVRVAEYTAALHDAGVELPVVAAGDYPADKVAEIMGCGVSGIALAKTISCSHDPVAETETILSLIGK